ncbi:hypothetical protein MBLNU459_g4155t1 [Dothideomycetes sp. NU459]
MLSHSGDYELVVRQQPKEALVTQAGKEKNRKPIDPPPIVELKVTPSKDPIRQYLQSPYLFMTCSLVPGGEGSEHSHVLAAQALCGQMVSSLHRLKDTNNEDGGFFVFGDVSVRLLGRHHLVFSLFELRKENGEVAFLKSVTSEPFDVVQQKAWHGLEESTYLSRAFSDQGVRLRLRKENRTMAGAQSAKRAYSTFQEPPQAGPSNYAPESQSATIYSAGQVGGSQYGAYGDIAPKRQRSDDQGPPEMYAHTERAMPIHGGARAAPAIQSSYQMQQPVISRQSPQVGYGASMQQNYYTPATSSAPARVLDASVGPTAQGMAPSNSFGLTSALGSTGLAGDANEYFPRRTADSVYQGQQAQSVTQSSPIGSYQGSGESMYPHHAHMASQSSVSSQSAVHTPTSATRSVLNPSASTFQPTMQALRPQHQYSQSYGSMTHDASPQYSQYPTQSMHHHYRQQSQNQPTHTTLLEQPLTAPPQSHPSYAYASQQQHQQQHQQHPHQQPGQYDSLQHGYAPMGQHEGSGYPGASSLNYTRP